MSREAINKHGGEDAKSATGDRVERKDGVKVEALEEEEENGKGRDRVE